jgi:hypothetical protein
MAAETVGHAAWLAFDLGRHQSSASLYVAARDMGAQSGDQALHAYIGGFESIVALAQEKPTRAAMLLDAASGDAARSPRSHYEHGSSGCVRRQRHVADGQLT